jgi:hypothetical protein
MNGRSAEISFQLTKDYKNAIPGSLLAVTACIVFIFTVLTEQVNLLKLPVLLESM